MFKSSIAGVGKYLPVKVLTNTDLSKMVDTSDEWITQRTGIKQRHIVSDSETCADIAIKACVKALANANMSASDIDGVIVATTSADRAFPSVACDIAKHLGIDKGFAYDVGAACAGFVFALNAGDNAIRLGQATNILIVGTEVFSRFVDWTDRNTCILFGDGAGAVVLSKTNDKNSILSTHIFSKGEYYNDLLTESRPNDPENSKAGIHMDGKTVYKFAVNAMSSSVLTALEHNGYSVADIQYVVPHQANLRIIEAVGKNLGLTEKQTIISLPNHANTSAATIPLALDKAVQENTFKSGDLIALTAMGAGFSWGSVLLRWK